MDRLVGNLRLGELSDRMVSEIVEAQPHEWASDVLDPLFWCRVASM
jgi:hypothetical protein